MSDEDTIVPTDERTDTEREESVDVDDVDEGILFELQRDARNVTIKQIAEKVDVSSSTVRNRIEKLERSGVIEGYTPTINYEVAGFPLQLLFVCSSDPESRSATARDVLDVLGVVNVTEMITSEQNLYIETVSTSTTDLMRVTEELNEYGLTVHSSEIVTNSYSQPWGHFDPT